MKIKPFVWSLLLTLIFYVFSGLSTTPAQTVNQAGLVVHFSDDKIDTYCISFTEDNITGEDLLDQYSIEMNVPIEKMFYPINGAAICKIGNVGCPSDDCFCDSPPNNWSYWYQQDEEWIYSSVGASNRNLLDGDVDGWHWGAPLNHPELITLEEICNPTPTPTSTPTLTYTPKPTNTPIPTKIPKSKPTKTTVPTNIPSIPPTASYSPASNPTSPPTPTIEQYPTKTLSHSTQASPTMSTSSTVEPLTSTPSATTAPNLTNLPNTDPKEKPRGQSNSEEGGFPSKATGIVMPTRQTTPTLYPDSTSGTTSPILSTVKSVIYFLQYLISTVYSP
jgi:hypothetical protein